MTFPVALALVIATPGTLLNAIVLGIAPPIVVFDCPMTLMPAWLLGMPVVAAALVPIRLPWMTLELPPVLEKSVIPERPLPEMTFRAFPDPPMLVDDALTRIPLATLGIAAVPAG